MNYPASITTSAPSISTAAMLVELSIGTWTGRKLDKRASKDVTSQNNAATGVASVSKRLLGDCAELDAVQKFAANARNIHYACTMPWSDTGLRLLPTTRYFKYHNEMSAIQAEFERLVVQFLDAYGWEIQHAQLKLGSLFNPDEYPTRESLTTKFRFGMNYMPLPDAGDFRVDIDAEAKQVLASQYEAYYTKQFESAMADVWQRAYDAIAKMSERLDYTDDANKKIFRDSLVDNMREVVDLLGACNVTNDPVMGDAQRKLDQALMGVTPDGLREDAYLRAQTKQRVDEVKQIIANLPGLGM